MCIIVAKPMGVSMPSKQTLLNCFTNNPDGAGFMYSDGKSVYIDKGYFNFDDFYKAVTCINELLDTSIVMHFRISTAGSVNKACCHPFPVSNSLDDLSATMIDNRICVAHNGVISGMSTSKDKSDTMAYIMDVIAPLRRMHEDFIHDDAALEVLENTCGSKLCFLDNSGDIVTIGEFHKVDGVLYSNTSYTAKIYNYSSRGSFWGGLDYDEYGFAYPKGTKPDYSSVASNDMYDYDSYLDDVKVELLPYFDCSTCLNRFDCYYDIPYCECKQDINSFYEYDEECDLDLEGGDTDAVNEEEACDCVL